LHSRRGTRNCKKGNYKVIKSNRKISDGDTLQQNTESVKSPLSKLNERKARENNIIIHGIEEIVSENNETRKDHDNEKILEIMDTCKIVISDNKITRITRIGTFDKEKPKHPILVSFDNTANKKKLFKNIRNLHIKEKYKNVKITNDETRSERELESALWEEAKRLSDKELGDFI
jgi:hypothetical protein